MNQTQTQWVLQALQLGPITPMDALQGCGCFRLAARIKDLRDQGHHITTTDHKTAAGKTVARYSLTNHQQKAAA